MNTRPHTIVWIILLVFSWKCGKVRVLEATMETWKQAVLDCYGNNSFLESNTTVLKQYMVNHNEVNDSIWVGSFLALLPWIEIRGCYNIPLTCNSFETDERNATNLQLCQLKCMKRRYFAFNQKNKRCVCFDEHDVVKKETDNATFCQECTDSGDCNTHAVVYKVFDRPINLADTGHDCLSYQCNYTGAIPIFNTQECFEYSRSYCRDGRSADGPAYQHFFQYRFTCEENHFTYPLLYSENPVNLCNLSESLTPGRDVWVGVYRQKLYVDNSDNAVIQFFDQIEQYILRCDHLPTKAELVQATNCSGKHHYVCAADTQIDSQEEPINTTSTPMCQSEDPYTGIADNQSSGIIAGTVTSILVIGIVVAIVVFTCRRFNSKSWKRKENHIEGEPPKNKIQVQKAAEDENEKSRVVSIIVDVSNIPEKTINAIANPGYNDLQVNVDTQTIQNGDQQGLNSMANTMTSADYCLAKPTDPVDLTLYTDNADYDHLNSVKHHQEKDNVNLYDHVPNIVDSDDTYDHSAINMRTSESNNYDHFDVQN
ncbi:uncharacterized protein [Mytilus edulis]|uniref:uncharacterized protein isoform X2 n=1 Tax=Mytilus edulis TaxID=6550 RepID=UPI0039F14687